MKDNKIKKLIYCAFFMAIGIVLPFLTGQIKEIGDSLLPMHIPVLLCGFLCGWQYGFSVGLILPFLRSAMFSMPPMYPNSVWMSLELCTYGLMSGIVFDRFKTKNILSIYASLIIAMISGRIVWGIAKTVLLGFAGKSHTFAMFITGGFIDAVPGILLQLVIIPFIVRIYVNNNKKHII